MDKKKENLTKNYILDAFTQLIVKQGYNNITVGDIATKAGVSRMSFYRNFKSKEDLVIQLIAKQVCELKINIDNLEVKNQYNIVKAYFENFKRYKDVILKLIDSEISKSIAEMVNQKFYEYAPTDYMNKTSKYIPIYYFGAITHVLLEWLKGDCKESTDDMARLICKLKDYNDNFSIKK